VGVALMFISAVVIERNARLMGRACGRTSRVRARVTTPARTTVPDQFASRLVVASAPHSRMTDVGAARNAPPCMALDIGATKVEAALVARDGTLRARSRISDADHHDDLITGIIELSRRVMSEGSVDVVGVGCAGPMSRGGEEVSPLNIAQWRAFPLRRSLRDALGVDVYVDGDARALALAEGAFGAARDDSSYLSMVVSTGVGGGLVIDGEATRRRIR